MNFSHACPAPLPRSSLLRSLHSLRLVSAIICSRRPMFQIQCRATRFNPGSSATFLCSAEELVAPASATATMSEDSATRGKWPHHLH